VAKKLGKYKATIHVERGHCRAIPVQVWTGPEGSRRLKFPDFKKIGT